MPSLTSNPLSPPLSVKTRLVLGLTTLCHASMPEEDAHINFLFKLPLLLMFFVAYVFYMGLLHVMLMLIGLLLVGRRRSPKKNWGFMRLA